MTPPLLVIRFLREPSSALLLTVIDGAEYTPVALLYGDTVGDDEMSLFFLSPTHRPRSIAYDRRAIGAY